MDFVLPEPAPAAVITTVGPPSPAHWMCQRCPPTIFELLGGTLVIAGVYLALRPEGAERLEGEVASAD